MPYVRHRADQYSTLKGWTGEFGKHASVLFQSDNRYGFPAIEPWTGPDPEGLVAYNAMASFPEYRTRYGVHFHIHDNKFETVWTHPARSLAHILRYNPPVVLGPDFSMYTDWPVVMQMYSKFRQHWCCALWQAEGLQVVPTMVWSDEDSYEWAFDGFPKGATISISSLGCLIDAGARGIYERGFVVAVNTLEPVRILHYGKLTPALEQYRELVHEYPTEWARFKAGISKRNGEST